MNFPIRILNNNHNFDIVKLRIYSFILSIFFTLLSIFLIFFYGLNFGIEFSGGAVIRSSYSNQGEIYQKDNVKNFFLNTFNISTNIDIDKKGNTSNLSIYIKDLKINDISQLNDIKLGFCKNFPNVKIESVEYIGPKISKEFFSDALKAISLSLIAMMLYIWIRFESYFAFGVFISLAHDVIATFGLYSLLQYEFDLSSVAALLTIIGYSINDSIVIYDRIRENIKKKASSYSLKDIINKSINETLSRTIMTVSTTLSVCFVLGFFGGEALKNFGYMTFLGIAFGTYSSIFISAPILLLFIKKRLQFAKSVERI